MTNRQVKAAGQLIDQILDTDRNASINYWEHSLPETQTLLVHSNIIGHPYSLGQLWTVSPSGCINHLTAVPTPNERNQHV